MNPALKEEFGKLVRYLLGELSAPEHARVEERSMLDQSYAELLDEVEIDLVDAYVSGTLTPQQRGHFESNYLITRGRRESVQAALLAKAYRENFAPSATVPAPSKTGLLAWFSGPSRFRLAVAATIAGLVIVVGLFWVSLREPAPQIVNVEQNSARPARGTIAQPPEPAATAKQQAEPLPSRTPRSPSSPEAPPPVIAEQPRPPAEADQPVPAPPEPAPVPPASTIPVIAAQPQPPPQTDRPAPPAVDPEPKPIVVASAPNVAPKKKRIAVINFEYATVSNSVAQIFGTNVDIGKGISDMVVDRLVNDGTYQVVEGKALNKLIAEQNFSSSDRADSRSAAKIGKLLGVDAIIIGSISQFGRDDKSAGVTRGFGGGMGLGKFGSGGAGKKESKAVVQITTRLIDVNTGEILASASATGESTRSGTSLLGAGATAGSYDMSSSNFSATIIGEATNKAVAEAARKLDDSAAGLPTRGLVIDGLVADVNGSALVLNVGTKTGLRIGDVLKVTRAGREVMDPATGKAIRLTSTDLGVVTITTVDENSSEGTYAGSPDVRVGDHVR